MDPMELQEELENLYEWIDDHNLLSMDKKEYYKMTRETLTKLIDMIDKLEG